MSVSNAGNLYQDPLLSNVGSRFRNKKFIADRVLTAVPVPKKTFKWLKWDDVAFDLHDTRAVPKGAPNQISYSATKENGTCETEYLADEIDPSDQEQAGGELPLKTITTELLAEGLMLRREKTVADLLFNTAVITQNTTLAGANQWSHADSDPQKAIKAKADTMMVSPNILVCGKEVLTAIETNPKVRTAFQGQGLPAITTEWLAKYLGLEEIIVGEAWYNSAKKGQASSVTRLWGKDALLCYRATTPPSPLMDVPTIGYLPTMGGFVPGQQPAQASGALPVRIYTTVVGTRGTREGVTFLKAECDYGVLVSAPKLGFLWKAAVA